MGIALVWRFHWRIRFIDIVDLRNNLAFRRTLLMPLWSRVRTSDAHKIVRDIELL